MLRKQLFNLNDEVYFMKDSLYPSEKTSLFKGKIIKVNKSIIFPISYDIVYINKDGLFDVYNSSQCFVYDFNSVSSFTDNSLKENKRGRREVFDGV